MLSMVEFFEKLAFLQGAPAVFIVVITAALLLFLKSWRWSLAVLLVQYIMAGLLFAWVLEPQMAGTKLVVSLFVCLMLYLTGHQVGWDDKLVDISKENRQPDRLVSIGPLTVPADLLIRSALALAVGAVALIFLPRSEEAAFPGALALAAYVLVALGLLTLGYHLRPFKAGLGFLTFLTGFDLLYSALAFSNSFMIAFTAAQLVTALIITYLVQRRYFAFIERTSQAVEG